MKRFGIFVFIFTVLTMLEGCVTTDKSYTRSFFAMNTSGYITVDSGYEEVCDRAVSLIYEIEELVSVSREGSDIHRLNSADGQRIEMSGITAELLSLSSEYNTLFSGFDITLKKISDLWSFNSSPRVPSEAELKSALLMSGMENLHLDGSSAWLENGAQVDLGGVAKGYAVSLCAELLKEGGAENAVINLGGNIYVSGLNNQGSIWRIGVKEPFSDDGGIVGYIDKSDAFFVTSGVYERFFEADGKLYHHIINPLTAMPFENGLWSVLVVTDNGKASDILSTALFTAGLEKGLQYAERTEGLEAIFITDSREIYVTAGLRDIFTFTGGNNGYVYKS